MTQPLIKLTVALVTLTCWAMTLYKIRDLARDPRNPPLRSLWVAMATITLSLTVQPVAALLDRLVGVVDFGRVLSNVLTLVSAAAAQGFLLYMSDLSDRTTRKVRTQYAIMAAAVTAIVLLYALNPPPYHIDDPLVRSGAFYVNGTPPSGTAPYTYIYLAYLGWSMVQVARLSLHYARIATRPLLRGGLRLITTGSLIGLAYVGLKVAGAILNQRYGTAATSVDRALIICFTTAILLILLGSTVPSWGPMLRLDKVWDQAAAWRTCRQLRPLWAVIVAAVPKVALLPEPEGTLERIGALRLSSWRRARMTLEILDGYALVKPWMSRAVADGARAEGRQRGLTGDALDAAVEAALVVSATQAVRGGHPRAADSDGVTVRASPQQPAADAAEQPARPDAPPIEEIRWLVQVAGALGSATRDGGPRRPLPPVAAVPDRR